MDVDLRKLRYFVVVAQELNFGRAAARLHVAQPALSRQIFALERELGVVLLDRSKRGTALSPAGAIMLRDAQELLGQASALQRKARVAARGRTQLTIGFMPGVLVAGVVNRLRERSPELAVEVIRTDWDDQIDVVTDGRADASFVRLPVTPSHLTVLPLYSEPRLVALARSNPLTRQHVVSLADITELDLLQPPEFHPQWRDAVLATRPDALSEETRQALPIVHTVEEKLEHVAADRGMILVPESAAMFYQRPDVVYRHVDGLDPVVTGLAFDPSRQSPQVRSLVELVRVEPDGTLP